MPNHVFLGLANGRDMERQGDGIIDLSRESFWYSKISVHVSVIRPHSPTRVDPVEVKVFISSRWFSALSYDLDSELVMIVAVRTMREYLLA